MNINQKISISGITFSLSVQASDAALRNLLEAESYVCTNEELEALFLECAEQGGQQLYQARQEFLLYLTKSYCELLRKSVDNADH